MSVSVPDSLHGTKTDRPCVSHRTTPMQLCRRCGRTLSRVQLCAQGMTGVAKGGQYVRSTTQQRARQKITWGSFPHGRRQKAPQQQQATPACSGPTPPAQNGACIAPQ
eukprot:Amastigsp_a694321_38.p3 type:complete len:108 gc:universal Amastigsp_a694321_38:1-324(+)